MAKVPQINTSFHPDVTMPQPDYSALSSNPEELSSTASNLDTGRLAHFSGLSPMAPFTPASPFTSNMAAEHDHPGSPGQFSGGAQHAQSSGLSPPGSSPNAQFKVPQLKRRGSDASVASAHTHQPSLRPKASGLPQRAENGLMHIDIPRKFGEAGEYWKRYDDISERADKDMVEMLNANLDILLIFSGLFSGVNTAFLAISLVSLSPDSGDEMVRLLAIIAEGRTAAGDEIPNIQNFAPATQVVRVNCFWVASLTCSLLASAGAMLGKQWVVYYTQDPPGTLEAQGRARQRRFNGAERWKFRYIVELLPMLLQSSLLIFCIGLIDYFYALNTAVAWVVLALTAAGFVFYVACLIAAILDPDCPFRSLPSMTARKVLGLTGRWNRRIRRRALHFYVRHERQLSFLHTAGHAIHHFADKIRGMSHAHVHRDFKEILEQEDELDDGHDHGHHDGSSKVEDSRIDGQTACWIIETSEHETALLTAARNIPALHVVEGSRLDVRNLAFHRLLSLFRESLIVLASCNSPGWTAEHAKKALEATLIYGRAMGHVVMGSRVKKTFYGHFRGLQWPIDWKQYHQGHLGFHTNELVLLNYCLMGQIPKNFCSEHPKHTMPHSSVALSIYIAGVLEPSDEPGEKFRVAAAPIDRISLVQRLITGSFAAADPYTTTLLSLNAWALGHLPDLVCGDKFHSNLNTRGSWWKAYTTDDNLYPNIISALKVFHYYQRLVSAFHGHSLNNPHDHDHPSGKRDTPSDLLAPAVWYSTYTSLLRSTREVIDCGSRHQETLTKFCFKLDASLRRVDTTVSELLKTTKEGEREWDLLNRLRKEIEQLLQSIRIDGQQAMAKNPTLRSASTSTSSLLQGLEDNPHNLDDEGIYVVAPITLDQIADAMTNPEEDIRFSALSLCLDHLPESDAHLHPQYPFIFDFTQLTLPLMSYINKDDSLPLLSMVLSRLIRKSSWRTDPGSQVVVKAFQMKTRDLLTKRPTFGLLEASLNVWQECKASRWGEVARDWETEEFARLVETTLKKISHDQHAASHHGHDHTHDHTHDDPEEEHDTASHEKEQTLRSTMPRLPFGHSNGHGTPKEQPTRQLMNVPQPYIPQGLIAYASSETIKNLQAATTLQETYKAFVTLKDASWWVFHEK